MNTFIRGLFAAGLAIVSACTHLQLDTHTADVPPDPTVLARVILVGDAGRPDPGVLNSVRAWSEIAPDRTSVVFLGDNVYENGLPDGPAYREKAVLDRQIAAVGSSRGLFVPGNHDWRSGRTGINRQAAYVEANRSSIRFRPSNGCPGPATDDELDGIVLVALDTEWLLQTSPDSTGCDLGDEPLRVISQQIHEILDAAGKELVIVVAHHPPWTYGRHGGFYNWQDHIFPLTRLFSGAWIPLPVVGSIYPLGRKIFPQDQDTFSERYRSVHVQLATAFSGYEGPAPLIFAGGHDHSLQVLSRRDPWDYVLVSGAGSRGKLTTVTRGPDTVFARLAHGFITVDLYPGGRVLLRVIEAGDHGMVFTHWLTSE